MLFIFLPVKVAELTSQKVRNDKKHVYNMQGFFSFDRNFVFTEYLKLVVKNDPEKFFLFFF